MSRITQSEFVCTGCGFTYHADEQAAVNIVVLGGGAAGTAVIKQNYRMSGQSRSGVPRGMQKSWYELRQSGLCSVDAFGTCVVSCHIGSTVHFNADSNTVLGSCMMIIVITITIITAQHSVLLLFIHRMKSALLIRRVL